MSDSQKVVLNSGLVMGNLELRRFQDLMTDKGYKAWFGTLVGSYGKIQNEQNPDSLDLLSTGVSGPWKIRVRDGALIDNDQNYCELDAITEYTADETVAGGYAVYAGYSDELSTLEEGTVAVTASGFLTGTGTKFLEVLRGAGQNPVSVEFYNGLNAQAYQVAEVYSDTTAQLVVSAGSLTIDSGVRYRVVGNYTAGNLPVDTGRFPYRRGAVEVIVTRFSANKGTKVQIGAVVFDGSGNVTSVDNDGIAIEIFKYDTDVLLGAKGIDLTDRALYGEIKDTVTTQYTISATALTFVELGTHWDVTYAGSEPALQNLNETESFPEGAIVYVRFAKDITIKGGLGNINVLTTTADVYLGAGTTAVFRKMSNGDWDMIAPIVPLRDFYRLQDYSLDDETGDVTLDTSANQDLSSVVYAGDIKSGDVLKVTAKIDIKDSASLSTARADIVFRIFSNVNDGTAWTFNGTTTISTFGSMETSVTLFAIFVTQSSVSPTFTARKVSLTKSGTITPVADRVTILVEKIRNAN